MDATAPGEALSLDSIESFIRRWKEGGGSEIGNAQPCVSQLCTDVLGVEPPEPAAARVEKNTYVFERRVTFTNEDRSIGRIDCYKRGHFVLEAKQDNGASKLTEDKALSIQERTCKHGMPRHRMLAELFEKTTLPTRPSPFPYTVFTKGAGFLSERSSCILCTPKIFPLAKACLMKV